jgi:hypothetical protein
LKVSVVLSTSQTAVALAIKGFDICPSSLLAPASAGAFTNLSRAGKTAAAGVRDLLVFGKVWMGI